MADALPATSRAHRAIVGGTLRVTVNRERAMENRPASQLELLMPRKGTLTRPLQGLPVQETPSPLLLPNPDIREPASPGSQRFVASVAPFKYIASTTVAKTWDDMRKPSSRMRSTKRIPRAVTINSMPAAAIRFGAIINELMLQRNTTEQTELNLQRAAEEGMKLYDRCQELEDKYASLEEYATGLQAQLERFKRENRKLERDLTITKVHVKELTESADNDRDDETDEQDQVSLADFLMIELKDERSGGYTGDLTTDLQTFRQKVRKERRQHQMTEGHLKEVNTALRRELDELSEAIRKLKEKEEASANLQYENEALRIKLDEMNEQANTQTLEYMENMRLKHQAIQDAEEAKGRYTMEIKQLQRELMECKEEMMRDKMQYDSRIQQLTDQLTQLKDREVTLSQAAEIERLEQQKALQQSRLAALAAGKSIASGGGASEEEVAIEKAKAEATLKQLEQMQTDRMKEQQVVQLRLEELKIENGRLQKDLDAALALKQHAEQEIVELRQKLASFKEVGMSLRAVIEQEKERSRIIQEELLREKSDKEQLENRLSELEKDLQDAEYSASDNVSALSEEKLRAMEQEKAELEVKLMMMRRKDEAKMLELQKKEEELAALKKKVQELSAQMGQYEQKFSEIEKEDRAKFQQQYETINKITKHLQELYQQYNKKDEENKELQAQIIQLKASVDDADGAKGAKQKYKEMGKKMLTAMKQMDADMKELMKKLEDTQAELKAVHREKRRLQRKNEELQKEMEMTEKQMNKLMRICISGTIEENAE